MNCGVLQIICLMVCLIRVTASGGNEWSYEGEHSPEHWHEDYPRCGGKKQSPINIVKTDVVLNERLGKLTFIGYDTELTTPMLQNNGHSAQVTIQEDIFIEDGGLPSRFKAAQFHFHWGESDRRGSEHSVDSVVFPMEMHIVHYSTDYANFSEALNKPDGLAVLAVFFQVGDTENPGFKHIVSKFTKPIHKDEVIPMEPMTLDSLLPGDTDTYYRYSGSLTTPPCYESVVWTLYPDYVIVTEEQVNMFRNFLKANRPDAGQEVSLVNDYRPQQPINVRLVETNTRQGLTGNGMGATVWNILIAISLSSSIYNVLSF